VKDPAQSDPHRVVLFNMPEISRDRSEAARETTHVFATTPSIPTYLLCWCVGRFDSISTVMDNGTNVRVFAPPAKVKNCRLALDVAVKALDYYRDFFGVAYRLPKMDIVAIEDFPIGAMENWGLLTFKENYVLFDEQDGSVVNKQNVALVVAHEVAHQVCVLISASNGTIYLINYRVSVVWQLGYHFVVDSPLAEGGLRHVDRVPLPGPHLPRVEDLDAVPGGRDAAGT
jgi:hypothetical protein